MQMCYRKAIEKLLFQAEEIIKLKQQLNQIYVRHTGKDLEYIQNSMERDKFMSPSEALEFGIIDKILEHPPKHGESPSHEKDASDQESVQG